MSPVVFRMLHVVPLQNSTVGRICLMRAAVTEEQRRAEPRHYTTRLARACRNGRWFSGGGLDQVSSAGGASTNGATSFGTAIFPPNSTSRGATPLPYRSAFVILVVAQHAARQVHAGKHAFVFVSMRGFRPELLRRLQRASRPSGPAATEASAPSETRFFKLLDAALVHHQHHGSMVCAPNCRPQLPFAPDE